MKSSLKSAGLLGCAIRAPPIRDLRPPRGCWTRRPISAVGTCSLGGDRSMLPCCLAAPVAWRICTCKCKCPSRSKHVPDVDPLGSHPTPDRSNHRSAGRRLQLISAGSAEHTHTPRAAGVIPLLTCRRRVHPPTLRPNGGAALVLLLRAGGGGGSLRGAQRLPGRYAARSRVSKLNFGTRRRTLSLQSGSHLTDWTDWTDWPTPPTQIQNYRSITAAAEASR